jgi:hypothetical protein
VSVAALRARIFVVNEVKVIVPGYPHGSLKNQFVKAQPCVAMEKLSDQSVSRTDSFFLCSGNIARSFANF